MKILLIDDKAFCGWKQLLEHIFPMNDLVFETATTYVEAINKISEKYDMIFLDVRLDSDDNTIHNVEEFSGYKVLKEIKKDFLSINFSTPIILLTASNKIWNIDAFRNYGVDAYYIKEHPDFIFDKETSKQNYNNLKDNFKRLIDEGEKRTEIWDFSSKIINKINDHSYFKENKKYKNVKNRIIDKLKLGYTYLFKEQSKLEKELLKTNNEALAFIIYWSIFEEIMKGFSDLSTWDSYTYKEKPDWKFRNNEYFIKTLSDGNIRLNIKWNNNSKIYDKEFIEYEYDSNDYKKYTRVINLSQQIYSLLAAYTDDNYQYKDLSLKFKKINQFRNKIDFIHSDVKSIFEKDLINKDDLEKIYDNIVNVLKFIEKILSLI